MQIGTTAATASKLTVYGANDAAAIFQGSSTGTGAGNGFLVGNNGGTLGLLWNYENNGIAIATNDVERLRIDSSGRVGIGTNIMDSSAEVSITNASSSARVYMKSADNADCSIYFGSMNDAATGAIRYDHSDDTLRFYGYNNSERLRITSGGTIGINDSSPNTYFKLDVNGHTNIVGVIMSR